MKYTELIQRLQHNPEEAAIVYRGQRTDAAWIVNRQGVIQHRRAIDAPMADAIRYRKIRHVSSLVPSRAMLFRPVSDFTEAKSA